MTGYFRISVVMSATGSQIFHKSQTPAMASRYHSCGE